MENHRGLFPTTFTSMHDASMVQRWFKWMDFIVIKSKSLCLKKFWASAPWFLAFAKSVCDYFGSIWTSRLFSSIRKFNLKLQRKTSVRVSCVGGKEYHMWEVINKRKCEFPNFLELLGIWLRVWCVYTWCHQRYKQRRFKVAKKMFTFKKFRELFLNHTINT